MSTTTEFYRRLPSPVRRLVASVEHRWTLHHQARVIPCTIHRTADTHYAVLAGNGPDEYLRVIYTESLETARAAADQWRATLIDEGFSETPDRGKHEIAC